MVRGGSKWFRGGSEAGQRRAYRSGIEYIESYRTKLRNYGVFILYGLYCGGYTNERGASEDHQAVTCTLLTVS